MTLYLECGLETRAPFFVKPTTMLKLIHHGATTLDRERLKPATNYTFYSNKPANKTGFWASPVGSTRSWFDFANREGIKRFGLNYSFTFTLTRNARILVIDSEKDLKHLTWLERWGCVGIDWNDVRTKYDAIHLTPQGLDDTCSVTSPLHLAMWDCETVLVLNPDVISETIYDEPARELAEQLLTDLAYLQDVVAVAQTDDEANYYMENAPERCGVLATVGNQVIIAKF